MGEKNRVIGLYAYPGDELLGTFSRLDEIDESYYLFNRSPETGARIKPSAGNVVIIDSPRSRKPFPWRCGAMLQEALSKRISEGDTLFVPAFSERDEMRQAVMKTAQRIYAKMNYKITIIDYSIKGTMPKCVRLKITGDERR